MEVYSLTLFLSVGCWLAVVVVVYDVNFTLLLMLLNLQEVVRLANGGVLSQVVGEQDAQLILRCQI